MLSLLGCYFLVLPNQKKNRTAYYFSRINQGRLLETWYTAWKNNWFEGFFPITFIKDDIDKLKKIVHKIMHAAGSPVLVNSRQYCFHVCINNPACFVEQKKKKRERSASCWSFDCSECNRVKVIFLGYVRDQGLFGFSGLLSVMFNVFLCTVIVDGAENTGSDNKFLLICWCNNIMFFFCRSLLVGKSQLNVYQSLDQLLSFLSSPETLHRFHILFYLEPY